jgi:multiple sugar transport system substrate-binding protein
MFRCWTRRLTTLARAALAASLLLFAHGAFPNSASAQTIRMWSFLDPAGNDPREKALKKIIGNFETANPGVKILVEPQIWNQMTDKFFAAHQAGTAPDIMWVQLERTPAAVELGTAANLDDLFVKGWSADEVKDLDGSFWRYVATPSAHYQITHSRSYSGILYRRDLLKEAGIDPTSLTTWDKFIAAAKKLTVQDASGTVTRWGFGQAYSTDKIVPSVMFSTLLDKDKKIFDDKGRATWSTPAGVDGMTMQIDMIRKDKISPDSALSWTVEDLYDQFAAGRMAFIRGTSVRVPKMQGALGNDKVGFMPTPSYTEGKWSPSSVTGWSVIVWSGSKQRALAGKFVEYMSSKAADKIWSVEAGAVPIRQSTILENPEFFSSPKNNYLAVAADAMVSYGWFPPNIDVSGWGEDMNRAAQDILAKDSDVKAALQKAESEFNRRHRR